MTLPALDRTPVATRTNRAGLVLLGLLLLGGGLIGLVVGFGGFGSSNQGRPVLDPVARDFAATHDWFWVAVAAGCLVVAALALLWLRAQLSTDRLRTLNLESDRSRGATTMTASAVERACAEVLQARRGVAQASAVMLGDDYDYRLVLSISLNGRESLRAVDDVVQAEVLPQIRNVLDSQDLPVRIEYQIATRVRRVPM
ncbi:MAG: alkaline shock response membrane anchor protein AmaP [Geodermatophilaceae bacterium]